MAFGTLAKRAYAAWAKTRPDTAARLHLATLKHPTFAESAARSTGRPLAETTAELLADWVEARERVGQGALLRTADAAEGIRAFGERRSPLFRGD